MSCRGLVFTVPAIWLPSEGEMTEFGVSCGRAPRWWQAELEERVRDTQVGEALCFGGCWRRRRKVMQLPLKQNLFFKIR